VAHSSRGIAGYLIGREVAGTGEVLNLAVAPDFRRRGVARALLRSGLGFFRKRRVEEVYLEVRESNQSAQALYLSSGFRPVGQRAAYYRNPKEDALVLWLPLEQHA
jgi:ribosomal-protein-alanine N-acetyltransferase